MRLLTCLSHAVFAAYAISTASALTCEDDELRDLPFCDVTLSPEDRAADLVSRMTLEEKIEQIGIGAPALERLAITQYQYWTEALHGVAGSPGISFAAPGEPFSNATSFPQIINLGATFDRQLVEEMAHHISTEARAFRNGGHSGGLMAFSPVNINIFRDPRWGRGQETVGEDPFWASEFAKAAVRGLQFDPVDPDHIKIGATCKHYVANDFERFGDTDRHHFDAQVSPKDLIETFTPPFEACVEAGAQVLMCSYNAVNGKPMCANSELLFDLARTEWGFTGMVASDCNAIQEISDTHNFTDTVTQAVGAALVAGVDLDCSGGLGTSAFQSFAQDAIDAGDFGVTEDDVTNALEFVMGMRFRVGDFDPIDSQPFLTYGIEKVNTPEAHALALEEALKSMVLLQNDNDGLPFDSSALSSIAVIGPTATAQELMQGNYFGVPPFLVSPLDGIQTIADDEGIEVLYTPGSQISDPDTSGFDEAIKFASQADVTVVFVGVDFEAEESDRPDLAIPDIQIKLLEAISDNVKGRLVAVALSGGPLDYRPILSLIDSLVWAGMPGQSGGDAIAQVLFGEFNPSGRLPTTVYPNEFAEEMTPLDYVLRTNLGFTYRFFIGEPVFPFGFGLSYTTFDVILANVPSRVSIADLQNGAEFSVSVAVENTGSRTGTNIVLIFRSGGPDDAPLKELVAFDRAEDIDAKHSTRIDFTLDRRAFDLVNDDGEKVLIEGTYTLFVEDSSVSLELVP